MLGNGNVLLAAGENDNTQNFSYLSSAEFTALQRANWHYRKSDTPRFLHTARLLARGQALIVAGNRFGSIASVELYDPAKRTFGNTASLTTLRDPAHLLVVTAAPV